MDTHINTQVHVELNTSMIMLMLFSGCICTKKDQIIEETLNAFSFHDKQVENDQNNFLWISQLKCIPNVHVCTLY